MKYMKYKISLCLSALCFLTAFLLLLSAANARQEELASSIAPELLRFHVLAESDRPADQERKLAVKSLLVDYIREKSPEGAGKSELGAWLLENRSHLERIAEEYLENAGAPAPVSFSLTRSRFPAKTYGDLVFPGGVYDAARVTIGEGRGRNWWCVLYPALCFTEPDKPVVSEEAKELLQEALLPAEYAALCSRHGGAALPRGAGDVDADEDSPRVRIRLRFLDLLAGESSGA